jgi:poly-gamma-glutamate capsule biosynthesis protein CapA/YwtB (metallophosphatase superfamily)
MEPPGSAASNTEGPEERRVTLFLCGDVMTGRAIDQILPHPSDPTIYEPVVRDARTYIELAEAVNGPIPRPVEFSYIWGDALTELQRLAPDARIVNLETSVTRSDEPWPKGINYRMHPENIGCLTVAGIDVCVLANNHVLDYGYCGLVETLETLHRAELKTTGAGRTLTEARQPAIVDLSSDARVLVHGFGTKSSGIPGSWAATEDRPGVNFVSDLSEAEAAAVAERAREGKRSGDVIIASIHWGTNWGYQVSGAQIRFAHRLIDGGIDIVHGHSSHHPRPIEVYRNRIILYGCGDFINDYEGICGYEDYRPDLALMYFPTVNPANGESVQLRMTPMQLRKMRLNRAAPGDVRWLRDTLTRISNCFGSWVEEGDDGSLFLRWESTSVFQRERDSHKQEFGIARGSDANGETV